MTETLKYCPCEWNTSSCSGNSRVLRWWTRISMSFKLEGSSGRSCKLFFFPPVKGETLMSSDSRGSSRHIPLSSFISLILHSPTDAFTKITPLYELLSKHIYIILFIRLHLTPRTSTMKKVLFKGLYSVRQFIRHLLFYALIQPIVI